MNHFPNSKIVRVIFAILLISFLTAPSVMAAAPREFMNIWEGAKCGATAAITTGGPVGPCDLCDALIVGSNIIYNLFVVAIIVSVLMIVTGGIVFMAGGASEKNVSLGKAMMLNAVIGLGIALAAWVVINTLLGFLTGNISLPWNRISC